MKKIIKSAVIFAAMAFAASCFVSCSDGSDESSPASVTGTENGTNTGNGENQPGSGDTGNTGNFDDSSLKEAVLWVVGDSTVCDSPVRLRHSAGKQSFCKNHC